ncbi:MAG: NUDIX domain-containing protein [Caldilineaceae bacterium]|nr:NUDIX domain-containing protein [Caldilineaceae bacterium]MBP8109096.1 NUDIX domain-containing protein [Caldilineaceae bacterium]MBP8124172.1 NUDIX domain-containing protein [Caldilineaceae bacterium]MBP9073328.1 NUDIX domain-containing protein [Caldilineaceae bacterium]
MSEFPATQPVTVRREYPDAPLVGVAAAVFNAEGHVLLVKRGRPPGLGNWGLPGGLLDLGESLEAGVHREVWEECGVEIEIGGLTGIFQPVDRDDDGHIRYHYVVIDYWASHVSGQPIAQDDAADAAWVDLSKMAQLPMNPETRRVIREAHGAWAQR